MLIVLSFPCCGREKNFNRLREVGESGAPFIVGVDGPADEEDPEEEEIERLTGTPFDDDNECPFEDSF